MRRPAGWLHVQVREGVQHERRRLRAGMLAGVRPGRVHGAESLPVRFRVRRCELLDRVPMQRAFELRRAGSAEGVFEMPQQHDGGAVREVQAAFRGQPGESGAVHAVLRVL